MSKIYEPEEPWERQKGESGKAFEAFQIYRDQGSHRSLRMVAAHLGKSKALIDRWSKRWEWPERAREYDNSLVKMAMEVKRKEIEKMEEAQTTAFQTLFIKGLTALKDLDLSRMTPKDIQTYIIEGARMEALARTQGAAGVAGSGKGISINTGNGMIEDDETGVQIYLPEKDGKGDGKA